MVEGGALLIWDTDTVEWHSITGDDNTAIVAGGFATIYFSVFALNLDNVQVSTRGGKGKERRRWYSAGNRA